MCNDVSAVDDDVPTVAVIAAADARTGTDGRGKNVTVIDGDVSATCAVRAFAIHARGSTTAADSSAKEAAGVDLRIGSADVDDAASVSIAVVSRAADACALTVRRRVNFAATNVDGTALLLAGT